jgi:hypothetical protein
MTTIDYFRASRSSLFRPCGAKTLTASTGGTASFARVGKKRTSVNPQLDGVPKLPVPQLDPARGFVIRRFTLLIFSGWCGSGAGCCRLIA